MGRGCGKGPQKHVLAVRFLSATNDPDLMLASADLHDLKDLRIGDYDMNDARVEKTSLARVALNLARVMNSLEVVNNDPRGGHRQKVISSCISGGPILREPSSLLVGETFILLYDRPDRGRNC